MIKIDKNVPYTTASKGAPKYPFGEMDIGDSFFVDVAVKSNTVTAACQYGLRNGKKFSIRKHDGAYRCWRIA